MQDNTPSLTAMGTSLMRALHRRADPLPLLDDAWGDRLVPDEIKARMRARAPSGTPADIALDVGLRASAAYANVIVRQRYAEDRLADAVKRGVRQYVLIGAGFDSYALRRPQAARDVSVFEIDHPATQGLKQQRIADCAMALAENVHFIAADLSREELAGALARSAYKAGEPAFFAWLGVTMYLTRAANLATLRAIADVAPSGSEVVFNYADQNFFDNPKRDGVAATALADMRRSVAAAGEPFVSGFHPAELPGLLASCGLELIEDYSNKVLIDHYDPDGVNKLRAASPSHIARARVR